MDQSALGLGQVLIRHASHACESALPCCKAPVGVHQEQAPQATRSKGACPPFCLTEASRPPCGLQSMLRREDLGGSLANEDAGSHGVAGGHPWQD